MIDDWLSRSVHIIENYLIILSKVTIINTKHYHKIVKTNSQTMNIVVNK